MDLFVIFALIGVTFLVIGLLVYGVSGFYYLKGEYDKSDTIADYAIIPLTVFVVLIAIVGIGSLYVGLIGML